MNDHPLSQDLTKLTDNELDNKYNELSRRWQIAKRVGMDEYVLHQLDLMLVTMENEKYRRMELPEDTNTVILNTDPLPIDKKDKKEVKK